MPLQLPSFLRRRLRLYEARRALLSGAPEEALKHLSDTSLALFDGAEHLRERVLDVLCREAVRRASAGSEQSAVRLLDLVGAQDPERARAWRRRLADERRQRDPSTSIEATRRASESGIRYALETLLAELRRERSAQGTGEASTVQSSTAPSAVAPASHSTPAPSAGAPDAVDGAVLRFHLAVDDAGEFLVASGAELLIGHASAGLADLPFLADLDRRHAVLRHSESFHAGPGWQLEAVGRQPIAVGGRALGSAVVRLVDGDRVDLSPHLSFVFRTPEPGSASALLELARGAECEGAGRVLLLQPGSAGALRFAGRPDRLVQVRGLREEIRLELTQREIEVSSPAGLVVSGPLAPARSDAAQAPNRVRLACPPERRIDFTLARSAATRPPFGFSIRPLAVRKGPPK